MAYDNVVLEQVEPGIYRLTVNRPKALNALNAKTIEEIGQALGEVRADLAARVLLLTGGGDKAFVAGADITEMQAYSALEGQRFARRGQEVFRSLETLPAVAIAVVNGYCLGGGCELALSCDWILASDKAVFGQPEVGLGITPGFGGTQRLPRLVGRGMALELITTGRQVRAEEAAAIGLANHVYPEGDLMAEALKAARSVAAKGPLAVQMAKRAVHRGLDMDLDNGCDLESEIFGLCCATEDQKEGMGAFVEKRKPAFRGC